MAAVRLGAGSGRLHGQHHGFGHLRGTTGPAHGYARGPGRTHARGTVMNATQTREIRGVLITVSGGRLLLPNASVSEVITMSTPEPVENAPRMAARPRQLARLAGAAGVVPRPGRLAAVRRRAELARGHHQGPRRQSAHAVLRHGHPGLSAPDRAQRGRGGQGRAKSCPTASARRSWSATTRRSSPTWRSSSSAWPRPSNWPDPATRDLRRFRATSRRTTRQPSSAGRLFGFTRSPLPRRVRADGYRHADANRIVGGLQ